MVVSCDAHGVVAALAFGNDFEFNCVIHRGHHTIRISPTKKVAKLLAPRAPPTVVKNNCNIKMLSRVLEATPWLASGHAEHSLKVHLKHDIDLLNHLNRLGDT